MSITTFAPSRLDALDMTALLGSPHPAEVFDRRADFRHPLFATVRLWGVDNDEHFSAISREVSYSGIGLLHCMPFVPGTICVVTIAVAELNVAKTAEAVWCKPLGDDWFVSGWRFVTPA